MISFNAIQSPFSVPASATDDARIAAILALLEKVNAGATDITNPAPGQVAPPKLGGDRIYRSWRDAADSILEALEREDAQATGLASWPRQGEFEKNDDWVQVGEGDAFYIPIGGKGVPPRPRRITTSGELQWRTYTDLIKKLAELNPHHPLVASPFARRNSVPDYRELREIRDIIEQEIKRTRSTMPIPRLERHHGLPKEHRGIYPPDISLESHEYTAWILTQMHRLKPNGMHTGPDSWNKQWARWLYQEADLNKEKIDRFYRDMVLDFLRRYSGED